MTVDPGQDGLPARPMTIDGAYRVAYVRLYQCLEWVTKDDRSITGRLVREWREKVAADLERDLAELLYGEEAARELARPF